jgi:hypothetical protein
MGRQSCGVGTISKTISPVHVNALQCSDSTGVSYQYFPGQALPAACVAIDLCTNVGGAQTVLPWQDPVSHLWYDQDPNGAKGICKQVVPKICTDPLADNNGGPLPCTYPIDFCKLHPADCNPTGNFCKEHPDLCTNVDLCQPPAADAPGTQLGTGPWQVSGVWYGLSGGICAKSVCSNYPDATHTDTFYATPPTGEIALPDGTCGTAVNWCATHPCTGSGTTIKPIYKEN